MGQQTKRRGGCPEILEKQAPLTVDMWKHKKESVQ